MIEVRRGAGAPAQEGGPPLGGKAFALDEPALISQVFQNRQDLQVSLGDGRYVVFTVIPGHSDSQAALRRIRACGDNLVKLFAGRGLQLLVGIGCVAQGLAELKLTYHDAGRALDIGRAHMTSGCLHIDDFCLEKLVYDIPEKTYRRFFREHLLPLSQQKDWEAMCEMVRCWCEERFNFAQTARRLNIHKNTLAYRFNRFQELTGFDLHDFNSTMAIYLALLLWRRQADE